MGFPMFKITLSEDLWDKHLSNSALEKYRNNLAACLLLNESRV